MTDLSRSVDELAAIAVELVGRIRDDDPVANGRWLAAVLPDRNDWFRLAFVLAAAVPDDRSWLALTAWTVPLVRPAQFDADALDAVDEGPVLRPAPHEIPKARRAATAERSAA